MRPRLLAAALLLVAAGLWLSVTLPADRARDAARAEFARAREQRERLRGELAAAERRVTAGHGPEAGSAAARAMRASLLRAAEGLPVGAVQITPASDRRAGATGRLSAEGRMADVVLLADRLALPDSGVMVQLVRLASARADSPTVRVDVDCVSRSAGP